MPNIEQIAGPSFQKIELLPIQPLQLDRPWWQGFTKKLIDYRPIRGALAGVLTFAGTHGLLPQRVFAGPLPQEAETESLVAGAVADTPTEAESSDLVEVTNILDRLFLPEYKISWPDGKSFTVINPERGRKGWVLNPDKVVQLPVRDPNTFIPIRDSEGNLIMRSSIVKDELKTAMDQYKVPRIIFAPSEVLGLERPNGYLATRYGTPYQQPYLYFDVIVKPDTFPDALVYMYTFSEIDFSLDNSAENAMFGGIGVFLGRGIYEFSSADPNTVIRPKEGTPTDLGVMMYTLEMIKPVEHIYS